MTELKMKRCMAAILGVAGLVALSGCTATAIDPELKQSPNYSLGYNDGCATGNGRVTGFKDTVHRNDDLFASDNAYAAGWREGYGSCGGNNYRDQDVFGGEDKWHQQGSIGTI